MLRQYEHWNLKFTLASESEILAQVADWLNRGRRRIHITGVNPEQIVKAQTDPLLRQAINESDVVNLDGVLTVLGLRYRGCRNITRVATPELMTGLLQLADEKKKKVYLLGAESWVVKKTAEKIAQKYPNLILAGFHDGFYRDKELIFEELRQCNPDFLFVALPSPRKETFILECKKRLDIGVLLGVGGAFDVIGGKCRRAPRIFQKLWLEWLWRICQNPKQNGLRVLKFYPSYFKLIMK